ncbi:MAG: hypothetical protein HN392_03960 [Anaerolineae bacterium]|jgi:hypothetical protein|nr:hypothetical protein [Anaerolineae bacterium]MBT7073730.1 hypothetical protein [Anaerolineae bacterium]MBT7782897.1 hypothetical protein [Anaerolineae bacterium]
MSEKKKFSLMKPTLDTPYHIDFDWWQNNERNWRVYLRSLMCAEHREIFTVWQNGDMIDWIDPTTAEVKVVDGMQHTLMTHCALLPGFLTEKTTLVEAVFRLFVIKGNKPMTLREVAHELKRPEMTILRTLAGARVYHGLRPWSD